MIDFSQCRFTPFNHQRVGVEKLVERPYFALFDEMGIGKTKQVIDAAQILYSRGIIDRVIVVCPAAVRSVWFNRQFGELAKHLWAKLPARVTEYHQRRPFWTWPEGRPDTGPALRFTITNYDFIRDKERLKVLFKIAGPKTLLVLDESSAIKNWKAQQTDACWKLRLQCGRVILCNGTPIANNPGDLYTQGTIMHPNILGCKSWYHFRGRYGVMGGWQGKQIVKWVNLPDLQERFAPHVLRRLKSQCLDLPAKLDSIVLEIPLTEKTWKAYKAMKDDMVAWLSNSSVALASQTVVKAIRLAQITSGFVGGVEDADILDDPEFDPLVKREAKPPEEVGREKLDFFMDILKSWLEQDENLKLLAWSRFRPELHRAFEELAIEFPKIVLGKIWGGQKRDERDRALQLLDPRSTPKGPVVVLGTPSSGSMGLNLTAAHTVIYLSNDYSLKTRLQSEDRVHRPGQTSAVSYFDVVATGPKGQKTIDHAIIAALKNKENMANWTTSAWLQALREE